MSWQSQNSKHVLALVPFQLRRVQRSGTHFFKRQEKRFSPALLSCLAPFC